MAHFWYLPLFRRLRVAMPTLAGTLFSASGSSSCFCSSLASSSSRIIFSIFRVYGFAGYFGRLLDLDVLFAAAFFAGAFVAFFWGCRLFSFSAEAELRLADRVCIFEAFDSSKSAGLYSGHPSLSADLLPTDSFSSSSWGLFEGFFLLFFGAFLDFDCALTSSGGSSKVTLTSGTFFSSSSTSSVLVAWSISTGYTDFSLLSKAWIPISYSLDGEVACMRDPSASCSSSEPLFFISSSTETAGAFIPESASRLFSSS